MFTMGPLVISYLNAKSCLGASLLVFSFFFSLNGSSSTTAVFASLMQRRFHLLRLPMVLFDRWECWATIFKYCLRPFLLWENIICGDCIPPGKDPDYRALSSNTRSITWKCRHSNKDGNNNLFWNFRWHRQCTVPYPEGLDQIFHHQGEGEQKEFPRKRIFWVC